MNASSSLTTNSTNTISEDGTPQPFASSLARNPKKKRRYIGYKHKGKKWKRNQPSPSPYPSLGIPLPQSPPKAPPNHLPSSYSPVSSSITLSPSPSPPRLPVMPSPSPLPSSSPPPPPRLHVAPSPLNTPSPITLSPSPSPSPSPPPPHRPPAVPSPPPLHLPVVPSPLSTSSSPSPSPSPSPLPPHSHVVPSPALTTIAYGPKGMRMTTKQAESMRITIDTVFRQKYANTYTVEKLNGKDGVVQSICRDIHYFRPTTVRLVVLQLF